MSNVLLMLDGPRLRTLLQEIEIKQKVAAIPELAALPARFGLHFDRANALPGAKLIELEPLVLNLSHDRQAIP